MKTTTIIDLIDSIRQSAHDLQRQFEVLGIKPQESDFRTLKHVDSELALLRDCIQEFRQK